MSKFVAYFKYVQNHRKNVRKLCFKDHQYIMGVLHDIDKYLPDTFFPYMEYFYGNADKAATAKFDKAWIRHYRRSKHHWEKYVLSYMDYSNGYGKFPNLKAQYRQTYVVYEMPTQAVTEMIYDWKAMGMVFGDTAQEYYLKHYHEMKLHRNTRYLVECKLNLINDCYFGPICEGNPEYWMTLEELAKDGTKESFKKSVVALEEKYHIDDLYTIVTGRKE